MHVQIQAPHCPVCAAPVSPGEGAERVVCEYCDAVLLLERGRAAGPGRPKADLRLRKGRLGSENEQPTWEPMGEELIQHVAARFEMCMLEQAPGESLEVFRWMELPQERFAIVAMHCSNEDGDWVTADLEPLLAIVGESLADDGDPGLAANLALEELFARPDPRRTPDLRLCCALAVFDPARHGVTTFSAGYGEAFWWVSTEEGRCIRTGHGGQPLERRDLGRPGDVFSNAPKRELAASDLFVVLGAGVRGFGRQRTGAMHGLLDVMNTHLGEHPLRMVTLAKNRYWKDRGSAPPDPEPRPCRWLAVRAILPELAAEADLQWPVEPIETPAFDLAVARCPGDRLERLPLPPDVHGSREALVWMAPAPEGDPATDERMGLLVQHIQAGLGREAHGDNEYPHRAAAAVGAALETTGAPLAKQRYWVLHMAYEHNAVRWFCQGLADPLCLEARGIKSDRELGWVRGAYSAYPKGGARLWFPGTLGLPGSPHLAAELAQAWPGGKASRIYEALRLHWRTRRADKVLKRLMLGALSDRGDIELSGSLMVSSKKA